MTFVATSDIDRNLELKQISRKDKFFLSREVMRNLRKYLSTQVRSSQVKGLVLVLTLVTATTPPRRSF